ncbi:unnamed protein product [Meganyctiphanes norvegica]|uniref:USP domain-containing protein n=1 Tax=Meganyctiphanes norvegica TaxID=48144 RepID=A0AAV2RYV5_MEGNR
MYIKLQYLCKMKTILTLKDSICRSNTDDPGSNPVNGLKQVQGTCSQEDGPINSLKQAQSILLYLACSKLQHYVPEDIWEHPTIREKLRMFDGQVDASELFHRLLFVLDEILKSKGMFQLYGIVFGSSFTEQAICNICKHEKKGKSSFCTISLDVLKMMNVQESLYQMFKPIEINKYKCEKCQKINKTQKSISLTTLPAVLVLQLKRFDYDWDKECCVKLNDYLEFSEEIDMSPYTLHSNDIDTTYKLTGILTHDGDASGGIYISYVKYSLIGKEMWYKLSRNVTECIMDENLLEQKCFGGVGTCNAYMLFYTRFYASEHF